MEHESSIKIKLTKSIDRRTEGYTYSRQEHLKSKTGQIMFINNLLDDPSYNLSIFVCFLKYY